MKKAISAATSAALLASLLATAVAPSAFAAVPTSPTITGIGSVPYPGTSGAVTVSLHEQSVGALTATGSLYITLTNGTWTGTPVFTTAANSLGASVAISGSVMTIKITGFDSLNTEDIVVAGVKVKAQSAADITAAMTDSINGPAGAINDGLIGAFIPATTTANGTLQSLVGTAVTVNVTSACGFELYSVASHGATFGSQTGVQITNVTGTVPGVQNITLSAALTGTHAIGEAVSQTVNSCSGVNQPYLFGVVGTGKPTLSYGADPALKVFPGEANGNASDLNFMEPAAGYLTSSPATTLTLTIATAGVTFSKLPTALIDCNLSNIQFAGQLMWNNTTSTWVPAVQPTTPGACSVGALAARTQAPVLTNYQTAPPVMSADHKSISLTVSAASTYDVTTGSSFYIDDIHYDVAASVPGGTFVEVDAALNNGLFVSPTSNNNAVVFRGIAATATPTTVVIGQNNQKSGAITFTESTAGFFTDISSLSTDSAKANMFTVCTDGPDSFDPGNPPYAQVTPGTGVLVLRDGAAASTTGLVAGVAEWNPFSHAYCYDWTVWTASTAASTIEIGSKDMLSGALIDVPAYATPGPVNVDLFIGHDAISFGGAADAVVTVATRVFANQVAVTALSQPFIAPGTASAPGGNLQIAETGIGQLKLGESVCVEVMPRQTTTHDVTLGGIVTAAVPVATATGGVVLNAVSLLTSQNCDGTVKTDINHVFAFRFDVVQQSTTGTGKIVISNINYTVPADAVLGNVLVNVYGYGQWPTLLDFQSTVSNAKIGTAPAAAAVTTSGTALGATKVGPFTVATKVAKPGQYVTWKFSAGSALVGQSVQIWVATKNSAGKWSAFAQLTARRVDTSGNAYFWWKTSSKAWISVRAGYLGTLSVATQARWL